MSNRVQISVLLIFFAAVAWILPDKQRSANELRPSELIVLLDDPERFISADQVARIVVEEAPGVQLIDIRDSEDYLKASIPGSLNIPFSDIMNPDWSGYLDDPASTTILYSKKDIMASEAWILCKQKGFADIRIMEGGMEAWNRDVMESEFSGERISAAENALFEIRYRARDYFTAMNSLPDSLKTAYLTVKRKQEANLVGGCE